LSFFSRLFGARQDRARLRPLYDAVVAEGRRPAWYRDGGVPDTLEGRFDIIAAVLAMVLIRLEMEGERGRQVSVLLTEVFIDDMDGSLRELGVGDMVVGKRVGKLMGALGGRLGVFREGLEGGGIEAAVRRNVFRDSPPSGEAVEFVTARLTGFSEALAAVPLEQVLRGELPAA
jgi:cytochrome b pre-mRNA-processing protein 3